MDSVAVFTFFIGFALYNFVVIDVLIFSKIDKCILNFPW